ncbi:MAG: hypothetical protein GKR87_07940 [Kiritimatiellae bacterium]|nr:hypothetical protein [Kiritimatiellia bacterium]
MHEKTKKDKKKGLLIRAWFGLTLQERIIIGSILLIALIGLTVRYHHLKTEHTEIYEPMGIEKIP